MPEDPKHSGREGSPGVTATAGGRHPVPGMTTRRFASCPQREPDQYGQQGNLQHPDREAPDFEGRRTLRCEVDVDGDHAHLQQRPKTQKGRQSSRSSRTAPSTYTTAAGRRMRTGYVHLRGPALEHRDDRQGLWSAAPKARGVSVMAPQPAALAHPKSPRPPALCPAHE